MADTAPRRRRWRDSDILLLIANPILLVIIALFIWGWGALIVAGLILTVLAMGAMLYIVAAPSTTVGSDEPDQT